MTNVGLPLGLLRREGWHAWRSPHALSTEPSRSPRCGLRHRGRGGRVPSLLPGIHRVPIRQPPLRCGADCRGLRWRWLWRRGNWDWERGEGERGAEGGEVGGMGRGTNVLIAILDRKPGGGGKGGSGRNREEQGRMGRVRGEGELPNIEMNMEVLQLAGQAAPRPRRCGDRHRAAPPSPTSPGRLGVRLRELRNVIYT